MRFSCTLAVIGALSAFGGCKESGANKIEARQRSVSVSEDVRQLEKLINVPEQPTAVRWLKKGQPGGADIEVAAALHYSPEHLARILAASERFDVQPQVRIAKDVARSLLPATLQEGLADRDTVALEGIAVQPNLFVASGKSALIHGRALIMKQQGMVFLTLFSM